MSVSFFQQLEDQEKEKEKGVVIKKQMMMKRT
jgi:hypothetical protein